jgi:hypothetical protein
VSRNFSSSISFDIESTTKMIKVEKKFLNTPYELLYTLPLLSAGSQAGTIVGPVDVLLTWGSGQFAFPTLSCHKANSTYWTE